MITDTELPDIEHHARQRAIIQKVKKPEDRIHRFDLKEPVQLLYQLQCVRSENSKTNN